MHPRSPWLPALGMAPLALLATPAYAYELTASCEATITAHQRALLDDAVSWLAQNYGAIVPEVARDRAGANVHLYSELTADDLEEWLIEFDQFRAGDIPLDCLSSVGSNKCVPVVVTAPVAGLAVLYGWTGVDDILSEVNLCIDNFAVFAADDADERAAMAATVAHELMHHADGAELHGPGGFNDPANPDTRAETIGVAVEHLMLSGQLDAHFDSPRYPSIVFGGGVHEVTVWYEIENESEVSGVGATARSNFDRNPNTVTCVTGDDTTTQVSTIAVDGGTDDEGEFVFEFPAFDPTSDGLHPIAIEADCTNRIVEYDEDDNVVETVFSTVVDLALESALVGAPTLVTTGTPRYQLTYRFTVTNLDDDTRAPETDLAFEHHSLLGALLSSASWTVPSLVPGASWSTTRMVEINANATLSGPATPTSVWVRVDKSPQSIHDRDWSDNTETFVIDSAYWKPDYRIASMVPVPSPVLYERKYDVVVKNFGPAGTQAVSTVDVSGDGTHSPGSYTVPGLASFASSAPTRVTLTAPPPCEDLRTYTLEVDSTAVVVENDESNNDLVVSLGQYCVGDEIWPLFVPTFDTHLLEEVMYQLVEEPIVPPEYRWANANEFVEWFFANQGNGPFLPQIPPDYVLDYTHLVVHKQYSPVYELYSSSTIAPIRTLWQATTLQDLTFFVDGRSLQGQQVPFEFGLPQ